MIGLRVRLKNQMPVNLQLLRNNPELVDEQFLQVNTFDIKL